MAVVEAELALVGELAIRNPAPPDLISPAERTTGLVVGIYAIAPLCRAPVFLLRGASPWCVVVRSRWWRCL